MSSAQHPGIRHQPAPTGIRASLAPRAPRPGWDGAGPSTLTGVTQTDSLVRGTVHSGCAAACQPSRRTGPPGQAT